MKWESAFLDELEQSKNQLEKNGENNLQLWYEAGRSFGDISSSTMFQDADKLTIGIILMFLYVQLVLSNFNWIEWRVSIMLKQIKNIFYFTYEILI